MAEKGYGNGAVLMAVLLGIVIGAVGGFYVRFWNEPERPVTMAGGGEAATPMGGAGGGRSGTTGPAMGGMAGPASSGMELARVVRNLAVVQKVQNQGLTREQARDILPILKALKDAERLPDAEASAKLTEIDKMLTQGQRDALAAMVPFRGGGGRQGAGPAPAAGTSGPPSRPMAGSLMQAAGGGAPGRGGPGGMMGGGDPERPFASERNAAALDDLIGAAEVLAR